LKEQTGNQQRKANEKEVAWLCGLIDGEGSIGLRVQKYMRNKNVFYVAPYVQVVNTHIGTLDVVDRILTELEVGHYIDWPRPHMVTGGERTVGDYKPLWRILVNGIKRCHPLLDELIPYLVIKKDDASIVLEFINSRESSYYKHLPYSPREQEIIGRFRRVRRSGKSGEEISLESLNDYTQETPTGVKV